MTGQDLITGRHYLLTLAEAVIEVEYLDECTHLDRPKPHCYGFRDVKTNKIHAIKADLIEANVKDIPVVPGTKHDTGKLRYDLMVWELVEGITAVLTYGAKKYAPHNWKHVKGRRWRYFGALMRHLLTWWFKGEKLDQDTGLSHLFHAGCCLGFLVWCDQNPSPEDMEE